MTTTRRRFLLFSSFVPFLARFNFGPNLKRYLIMQPSLTCTWTGWSTSSSLRLKPCRQINSSGRHRKESFTVSAISRNKSPM